MSVMVLDAGNSIIKAKIARRDRSEISFPHALRQLTESEYQSILARSNTSRSMADYIRINGQPYVIGESAERHGVLTQRNGTARYSGIIMVSWQLLHLDACMTAAEKYRSLAAIHLAMFIFGKI